MVGGRASPPDDNAQRTTPSRREPGACFLLDAVGRGRPTSYQMCNQDILLVWCRHRRSGVPARRQHPKDTRPAVSQAHASRLMSSGGDARPPTKQIPRLMLSGGDARPPTKRIPSLDAVGRGRPTTTPNPSQLCKTNPHLMLSVGGRASPPDNNTQRTPNPSRARRMLLA